MIASWIGKLVPAGGAPEVPPTLAGGDAWAMTEPWIAQGRKLIWMMLAGLLVASFMTISGAVVTNGIVGVENNYKTLQHLDGGIVAKIFVKNGDLVNEGDVLVRLDDTQVRANLGVTRGKLVDALVQSARLEAELADKSMFILPEAIATDLADPHVARMLDAQRTLFNARRLARHGDQSVLRQKVEQLTNDVRGLEYSLVARTREYEFAARELNNVLPLFEKGYVNQQRVGPLQRDAARLEGDVGRLQNDLAKSKSSLEEARLKLQQSDKEFQSNAAEEARKVQAQISEFTENRTALEDKLARTEIRSPRRGRINALAPTTEGGVIAAGSNIAQIIPEGEKLVVEVRIQPQDIDKVRGGLNAGVKFPAFNSKLTPRLDGIVTTVSPAQINDNSPQSQGKPYFTALVELPPAELAKLGREHVLVPGMPAEVYIETTPRTILSYLVKPLIDSMSSLGRDH